jgi:hypothetical protein
MQANRKNGSATAVATPAQPKPCAPWDIPGFCRSYFYTGKLLTEGDLVREQRYMIDKLRLHHVALHGWGVVCGLMVRPHPHCIDRFIVTAGLALDDCGREVRLVQDCVVMLPKPPEPVNDDYQREYGAAGNDDDEDEEEEARSRRESRQTYYVCIRYEECKEDFMPVVFDDCCGSPTMPNRVCECAVVEVSLQEPACLQEIRERRRCGPEEHCHELWEHIPETCPPSGKVCCIPLAVIREYQDCEALREETIDNSIRPLLPSTERLERMIHCLMDHIPKPPPRLTRISRFRWEHEGECGHIDFLREYVGSHDAPQGFEIEFDGRVHPKGLNNRTFQAMIVREPPDGHEPRHIEIAPARVIRSEDGYRCTLHIDPEYARHHLRDGGFEVIITLRCDKVIDEHGRPVDGNLMAALREDEDRDYVLRYPTGDGVPGGLFESWIRVRRQK